MLLNRIIYALPSRLNRIIYTFIRLYYRRTRTINFRSLKIQLLPTVFHPNLYLTTETLLDFLLTIDLKGKSTLELGCGSGAISLYLSKFRGVKAHVSDINPSAISGIDINSQNHKLNIVSYHSDLFIKIPRIDFDIVILNPPFFNDRITSVDEYAFNTGDDFQYFKNLTAQLLQRRNTIRVIYMILTKKSDINQILSEFSKVNFIVTQIHESIQFKESLVIFSVSFA